MFHRVAMTEQLLLLGLSSSGQRLCATREFESTGHRYEDGPIDPIDAGRTRGLRIFGPQ